MCDFYSLFHHILVKRFSLSGCFRQGRARLLYLTQFLICDDVKHGIVWDPAVWVYVLVTEAGEERERERQSDK